MHVGSDADISTDLALPSCLPSERGGWAEMSTATKMNSTSVCLTLWSCYPSCPALLISCHSRAKSCIHDLVSITPDIREVAHDVSTLSLVKPRRLKKSYTDSTIRFSAEITGTIIVQCIPVLRPFLQEVHAAISSRTFGHSSANAKTTVSQNKYDPSAGTYSVTVTTIAAEKAAQKGSKADAFGPHGQVTQEFDFQLEPRPSSRGPSRDPSDEFELPIQKTHSGWSPVNSRE